MADTPEKTRFEMDREKRQQRAATEAEYERTRRLNDARFKAAAEAVSRTPEGVNFLVCLFHLCAYNRTSVVVNPATGEVLPGSTAFNDARRSVYVDVRSKLSPEARAKIEALAEAPVEDNPK